MNTKLNKREIFSISAIVVALIIAGIFISKERISHKNLEKEKIKNEVLLSEKLKLTKENEKLNAQILSLGKLKADYESRLAAVEKELLEKAALLNSQIQKSNAEKAKLKKSIEALEKERDHMIGKLKELNSQIQALETSNKELKTKLEKLTLDYDQLALEFANYKANIADNFCTEALRGKENKTTSFARRANKLQISFDLPKGEKNNLTYTLTSPDGKVHTQTDKPLGSIHIDSDSQEMATLSNDIKPANLERFVLTFKPDKKLAKGVYKFNLYNNDKYVGSTQLKLR